MTMSLNVTHTYKYYENKHNMYKIYMILCFSNSSNPSAADVHVLTKIRAGNEKGMWLHDSDTKAVLFIAT